MVIDDLNYLIFNHHDPIEFFNRKHYDIIVEKGVKNDEKNSL